MNNNNSKDDGPGLVGIVAFMVAFIAAVVAALLAAAWAWREANALSPHHFERKTDGTIDCRFEMSKIGIVLSASFAVLVYAGLPAAYLGAVAVDMGFPEIGSVTWLAVFCPLFFLLTVSLSAHRFNQLAALQSLVWERPDLFNLAEPRAVGFLSFRDVELYRLYAKAVPKPVEAAEWVSLASAGAGPNDVERWASVRKTLPEPRFERLPAQL